MASISKNYVGGSKAIGDLLHPREDFTVSTGAAPIGAVNGTVGPLGIEGAALGVFSISGAYSLTLIVEATRDGVNWDQLPFRRFANAAVWVASWATANTTATFGVDLQGYDQWRIRCSAWVSGSVNVTMATVNSQIPALAFQKLEPNTDVGTTLGAANTVATLTLAAPGVGLFHYISDIMVKAINGSAAAVAGSALINVTTTNLPGALNWRFDNNFAAWSVREVVRHQMPNGLRSSTVVPALGAGVQAEVTAIYRLGR